MDYNNYQNGYQQPWGNQPYAQTGTSNDPIVVNSAFAVLMRKVYVWMALALAVTGLTAYGVANSPTLVEMIFTNQAAFWICAIIEFGLVIGLSAAIHKLSFMTAAIMFVVYSIVNGVTMSFIFIAYTATSVAVTFFISAGTFAALALVGFFSKKDFSAIGKFLMFALIGVIIASVVNIFVKSSGLEFVTSIAGVLLFAGLTAYDSQRIKENLQQYGGEVNDTTQKIALMGALSLYLDFINLFLYLLRFLGKARE